MSASPEIASSKIAAPKIIVLDDDPTGSQTVHSCLLLLKWDVETLLLGLQDASPIFFVLTNTRALSPAAAAAITHEVCENLKQALARTQTENFLLVSRSDSTLRGHYPIETDVIAQQLGPFDAHFLTPEFFEAGRVTLDGTHYIQTVTEQGIERVPTDQTEFAQDSVFGYSTSYLPAYVEEKTQGTIAAKDVIRLSLNEIRRGSLNRLMALTGNTCVAVDGEQQSDLDRFAQDLLVAAAQGKKFLFRSAASLLTSLANLPPQPTAGEQMHRMARSPHGAVVVGSHVQKTTRQLQALLAHPGTIGVEIDVAQLRDHPDRAPAQLLQEAVSSVQAIHSQGKTPVIYTSRQELTFPDTQVRLAFGEAVSALLMEIVRHLPADIGFLISKGGITSNDTLSKGLSLTAARLLGQVIPGVSVITTPADHAQFPSMPVVLFPGNVGDDQALAIAYQRLSATASDSFE